MNIAVACTEDGRISRHFGRSTHFSIFEMEDGQVRGVTTLNVSTLTLGQGHHHHDHGPGHEGRHHKHEGLVGSLAGCTAVLAEGIGNGIAGTLLRQGITPVVVAGEYTAEEAVAAYVGGVLKTGAIHDCCGHRHGE
jgi:predicted Fe-Mo cluster-binding NifX family protein